MPIVIQPRGPEELALWQATAEISRELPRGSWTLVGAQMVFLLAYEYGLTIGRTSADIDLLVDVRLVATATTETSLALERIGYQFDPPTPDGRGHRFRRGETVVDVLAPDNLGPRAWLFTFRPARTIAVPGGTQALSRSRLLQVALEGETNELPCPSLLGGILLKARAVAVAEDPDKHRRDLCLLLSAAQDPRALSSELTGNEKRWLKHREELLDPSHAAWRGVTGAEDGRTALEILSS